MRRRPGERSNPQGPREPWVSFLKALDGRLDGAVELHCIGGFVITMHFGLSRTARPHAEALDRNVLA
jgi:hypothetical protein